MAKSKKNAIIVLRCYNMVTGHPRPLCREKIIITQFHNGVFRFLCPKCGAVSFGQQKNDGMTVLKGYSQYIFIDY